MQAILLQDEELNGVEGNLNGSVPALLARHLCHFSGGTNKKEQLSLIDSFYE